MYWQRPGVVITMPVIGVSEPQWATVQKLSRLRAIERQVVEVRFLEHKSVDFSHANKGSSFLARRFATGQSSGFQGLQNKADD